MSKKPLKLIPEQEKIKDIKYNWHEDPYGYYSLAKEIELPYNLYEIFSSSLNEPNEEELSSRSNVMKAKSNLKTKLNIPVIETIILENGQIINWINNDKDGFVAKKN